jgi:hypothetical protein
MNSIRPTAAAAILLVGIAALACGPKQERPSTISLADFQQLTWLEGTWRGSGGDYAAFFEEYRFVDDSTIQMKSFADSTLRTVTDSSRIELRGGAVNSRSARSTYAGEVTAGRIAFKRPGSSAGGHTFERVSDDHWTATLHPATAGGRETVYQMRKIAARP